DRQRHNYGQWTREECDHGRQGPRAPAQALSDEDRQVDAARARHGPPERHAFEELRVRHPLPALNDVMIDPCCRVAAETRHPEPKERGEGGRQFYSILSGALGTLLGHARSWCQGAWITRSSPAMTIKREARS